MVYQRHHFISYSTADAQDFAIRLHDSLESGYPKLEAWLDKRDLKPHDDWDSQIDAAIRDCASFVFVMTPDSVEDASVCKLEWTRALQYKKNLILLKLQDCETPFRLQSRQYIDFKDFDGGVAKLRTHIDWLKSPEAEFERMKDELVDMQRKLRRAPESEEARIQAAIAELQERLKRQESIVADPDGAAQQTDKSIEAGIQRQRQPEQPKGGVSKSKFINTPPAIAPRYFQDRFAETQLLGDFLKHEQQVVFHLVGRGGIGKTAVTCRLLKALENGELPDNNGKLDVNGIVYLSAVGSRQPKVHHLFSDLARLLPDSVAAELEAVYKNPQLSTKAKIYKLLEHFQQGRTIVLMDNFEDMLHQETFAILDPELHEALMAILDAPQHGLKVLITTRLLARDLSLQESHKQFVRRIEEGLDSPYAETVLREMDSDGTLGLKNAPLAQLTEAKTRTRGYPRALEALVAWLRADINTSLAEVLHYADQQMPEKVVEALVGQAFNRLDTESQQIMQALAIYGRPVSPVAVDYLLKPFVPQINSAPILSRLVNMHFARREGGSYYLHPVDRQYALGLIPRGEESDRFETGIPPFSALALYALGADFFASIRKPREDYQTIEDLNPQLDEFDLRCAAEDWNTAADVLFSIDWDYLLLWGYYQQMASLHERLDGKVSNQQFQADSWNNLAEAYYRLGRVRESLPYLEKGLEIDHQREDRLSESIRLGNMGNRYLSLGELQKAISYYQDALLISRDLQYRRGEGIHLGNLGSAYSSLGDLRKSIDYYQQALEIDREVNYREGEAIRLANLGNAYLNLGDLKETLSYYEQALKLDRQLKSRDGIAFDQTNLGIYYQYTRNWAKSTQALQEAIAIADEISLRQIQNSARFFLAATYLYQHKLVEAQELITEAQHFEFPDSNQNVYIYAGIIALRLGQVSQAEAHFHKTIELCDGLLESSASNFDVLQTKGLALCGLTLTGQTDYLGQGIEAFKAARRIVTEKGIVDILLMVLDSLAPVDSAGILAEARKAAAKDSV